MKTLKNGQKQAIKFDRYSKNATHRFHQRAYYKLWNRGGYLVLVNYQSLVSKNFPSGPLHLFFSIKYKRNRLLCVSFLEL